MVRNREGQSEDPKPAGRVVPSKEITVGKASKVLGAVSKPNKKEPGKEPF